MKPFFGRSRPVEPTSHVEDFGFAALLMVPVVAGGVSVGLLEVSRRTGRPWTSAEIDHARLVAQSLAATVRGWLAPEPLPWSPDALAARTRR